MRLLPRITTPPLSEAQIADFPPSDFLQMAQEAVGFFMSRALQEQVQGNT